MKLPNCCAVLVAVLLSWAGAASLNAAVSVSVDFDNSTPGVQSQIAVVPGQHFTAWLLLDVDQGGVSGYSVSLNFNTAALAFDGSPAATISPPSGWLTLRPPTEDASAGLVSPFEAAADLGKPGIPGSASFYIGSINFTALSDISNGHDILPIAPTDVVLDFTGNEVTPSGVNGIITPVPEPTMTALLIFSALFTPVMLWRSWPRRSAAGCEK